MPSTTVNQHFGYYDPFGPYRVAFNGVDADRISLPRTCHVEVCEFARVVEFQDLLVIGVLPPLVKPIERGSTR
jgi:hypothetical protein